MKNYILNSHNINPKKAICFLAQSHWSHKYKPACSHKYISRKLDPAGVVTKPGHWMQQFLSPIPITNLSPMVSNLFMPKYYI